MNPARRGNRWPRVLYSPAMQGVLFKLRGRLRHGLATQEALDRLARLGIVLYPYIVFQEAVEAGGSASERQVGLTARKLTEQDITALAEMPERPGSEEAFRTRFRRGHVGIGAFDGDSIVAYTWCDLENFAGFGQGAILRKLQSDEAYLYDAYTLPAYRGRGIVPFLRSEVYRVMNSQGRHRLYSISLFFNQSARRFKAKLNAQPVELRLSINLFQKLTRDLLLKRYAFDVTPSKP